MSEEAVEELTMESIYSIYLSMSMTFLDVHQRSPLEVGAIMNALAMTMYRTTLNEEEYERMCQTIYDNRHKIQTINPTAVDETPPPDTILH